MNHRMLWNSFLIRMILVTTGKNLYLLMFNYSLRMLCYDDGHIVC